MSPSPILTFLHMVVEGRSLTESQAEAAMRALLAGESTPALTAAFLTALRMKGETVEELTGFARAMRDAARTVRSKTAIVRCSIRAVPVATGPLHSTSRPSRLSL